jgi:signal transduction histidine kinase
MAISKKKNNLNFVPIDRTLLINILVASGIITTVITVISFTLDYKNEIKGLETTFKQVESSNVEPIAKAVWSLNEELLNSQIKGIIKIKDINKVYIINENNENIISRDNKLNPEYLEHKIFKLKIKNEALNKILEIGTLHIIASKDNMYQRLIKSVLYVFVTQGLKTLIISIILLQVFRREISGQIHYLTNYFRKNDLRKIKEGANLKYKMTSKNQNEFNLLINSVNEVTNIVAKSNINKQQILKAKSIEVENHQINALNSARLAAIGEMSSGLAHEINSPLTVITISSQKLSNDMENFIQKVQNKENLDNSELLKFQQMLKKIKHNGNRIKGLVEGMRRQSRDGTNDKFEEVSFQEILNDITDLFSAKYSLAKIQLNISGDLDSKVYCQKMQISQVLVNMLNNSFDEINKTNNPWVNIDVVERSDDIKIQFTDSGSGIPIEIQDNILKPFFTTKDSGKGTGLGLSISLKIIKSHGGNLIVDSECKNTRFIITIPKNQEKIES